MKSTFLIFSICVSNIFSLSSVHAQVEPNSAKDSFVADFPVKYQGEYTLNPSATCQPVRKSTRVKIDLVSEAFEQKLRVIYIAENGRQVASRLYPLRKGKIAAVNSTTNQPNSLLWETDVIDHESGSARSGTNFERMTFSEHALSFDVLKMRDPTGFWRFFKSDEKVGQTRCNFTRTEFMNAPAGKGEAIMRRIKRQKTAP